VILKLWLGFLHQSLGFNEKLGNAVPLVEVHKKCTVLVRVKCGNRISKSRGKKGNLRKIQKKQVCIRDFYNLCECMVFLPISSSIKK